MEAGRNPTPLPPRAACLLAAAVMALSGCGEANKANPAASVTIKLPPPRPAEARPGFSSLLDESAPQGAQAQRSES
jgi:hypothetical protein